MSSNAPLAQIANTVSNGGTSTNPFITYFSDRDPTAYDVNFPIKQRWFNTDSEKEFILVSYINSSGQLQANWVLITTDVNTTFIADSGSATATGDELNILGIDSVINNDNGIMTIGFGNTIDVALTNRSTGSVSTADATPTTILTFALGATAGVYYFRGSIVAFDATDIAGGAYDFSTGMRTTGVAATELGTEYKDVFEEATMASADFNIIASGNNLIVQVVGIAAKTIRWNSDITFRFVS